MFIINIILRDYIMSKILNTDFFVEQEFDNNTLTNKLSCDKKSPQSFLYTMDDCTHLDFSGFEKTSQTFAMDDCTDLTFDKKEPSFLFAMDDCTRLDFSGAEGVSSIYAMDDCVNLSF